MSLAPDDGRAFQVRGASQGDPVLRAEDHERRNPSTLNLSARCNQRCTYCAGFGLAPLSDEEIRAKLRGRRELFLQGGEPTLHPELFRYVRLAKAGGCETVNLVTNGLRLAYPAFARGCLDAGVDRFLLALPSHRADTCAALTRVERALALKVEAIRNLVHLGAGRRLRVVHVLVEQNARDVDGFVRFVTDELPPIEAIELKLVQCLGRVESNWSLMPSLTALRRPLGDALDLAHSRRLHVTVTGVPPCLFPAHAGRASSDDMRRSGETALSGHEWLPSCAGCALVGSCLGIRTDYLKIFGAAELEAARRCLEPGAAEVWPPEPPRRRPLAGRLGLSPAEAYAEVLRALRDADAERAIPALRAALGVHGAEPAADQLADLGHLLDAGPRAPSGRPVLIFAEPFAVALEGEVQGDSASYRDFAVLLHGAPDQRAAQRLFAQDLGRLLAQGDRLTVTVDTLTIARGDRLIAALVLVDPRACRLQEAAL